MNETISRIEELTDESLTVCVDTTIYSVEALFRTCYSFTDRCYIFLRPADPKSVIEVRFSKKSSESNLALIAGEFSNELVNQRVRMDVAGETRAVRELIVAQAFAES